MIAAALLEITSSRRRYNIIRTHSLTLDALILGAESIQRKLSSRLVLVATIDFY
jgi:hypothetical protein